MRASLFIALWIVALPAWAEEREVLSDFEQPGLAQQFEALAKIQLSREPIAEAAPAAGPTGTALRAKLEGQGTFVTKNGALKQDLLNASDVELWIHRSADDAEGGAATLEVQFFEPDGQARFWSKLTVDHTGWKKHTLPLRWFRWGEGRIPRWDKIDRWGLTFRDPTDVQIDNVALVRQDDPDAALPQVDDYATLAFPEAKPAATKKYEADGLKLLTNALELDVERLGEHLQKVQREVEADCGKLSPHAWPATMIVFATQEEYRAFFPRLAAQYRAEMAPPKSAGFTAIGVAASYWDAAQGTLRPVYTHEFVHAALSRHSGLPNHGEWLQEGLASMYQLRHHPQADFDKILRTSLAKGEYEPLPALAAGDRIAMNRYWQAATLCELLAQDKKYQGKLPRLIAGFSERGKTELASQCKEALGVDMEELEADWKHWCANRDAR
jgi:hypothetical protein